MTLKLETSNWKLRSRGLTRLEVLAIIAGVAALIIVVVLPALFRAAAKASRACCQCNLKQVGLAYRTWEGDYHDLYPPSFYTNIDGSTRYTNACQTYLAMFEELNNPRILVCPTDSRKPTAIWSDISNTNTSYFVGLDADETSPAMLLSGDWNLATNGIEVRPGIIALRSGDNVGWSKRMHHFAGNFGLADGSVQQSSSASFSNYLQKYGVATNRLTIP